MQTDPIVIASYARTPMGGFQGAFSSVTATELGAIAVRAAVERAKVPGEAIDRIYMGCVLPAALGQAPARQAALGAGLPESVQATTVNKMCGSGMQAIIMAAEALRAAAADVIVAGGMESMTNAPYALPKHRSGARIGHDRVIDTMMMDGLEDAYSVGKPMGAFAQDTADAYRFTREMQDAYALRSLERARAAIETGAFAEEIVPVPVRTRSGSQFIATDEQPGRARPEKIPTLKPAFASNGTITAASSASISDGAAAIILTRRSVAERLKMPVIARLSGSAAHAHAPALFTTAPVHAIRTLLGRTGWSVEDVDLFEVNEAFAAVAMIAARDLAIPDDRLNVNGGATALGHPIGASGARILATLLAALQRRGGRRGVAALCIGGGEATAMAIELI
ncbi:acetyl-CoA acetyltransferase [Sphingobium sp. 22B]|uniref:acetyl-CoA C-acyltransferase n=1 Tax=unclassified Sphingobium TaxID=2611147 RepID=UPI000781C545|nr:MULTISPECIES: acetyl-CoA C-acyltransferase [unclassified Sphingobium]KXU30252.1 acetyl-CoA acetyltransferase [Sphingobium sp. AM]KYC30342.1 acetyl-CoA acetyltransferase [Sphingobium sp. 22B]OAP29933.1 acetyl-CoA acetyltransferase [Sphingobium sp. 20006FA]